MKHLIEQHKILEGKKEEELLSLSFFSIALILELYFNLFKMDNRGDNLLKIRMPPSVEDFFFKL